MSIASVVCTDRLCGQICGKYTVYSNTSTYFSSLTSFSFLGDVFYVSCRCSAFPLPPSASYRRKHETAKLPYFDTTHCTIIERMTCNGVVYDIAPPYKIAVLRIVVALSPGIRRAISQPLYGLSTRNLLRRLIGQCINEIQC